MRRRLLSAAKACSTCRSVFRAAAGLVVAATLAACATTPTAHARADTRRGRQDLAPDGKLRAAINFGNPILATRDAATGEARGVSVDLARELARRLGVPVELVLYTAAGKVVEGLQVRGLGRGLRRDRSGARGRHGIHGGLRGDRRRVPRAAGLADPEQRRRRSRRRARRRRRRQRLRSLPRARAQEGAARARADLAGGRRHDGRAEARRRGGRQAAARGRRETHSGPAPARRPLHGHQPGDGHAEGSDRGRDATSPNSSRK